MKAKAIPLELVNVLVTNHSGQKVGLMDGTPIKIHQKTKDVLSQLKMINGMSSINNTIELLIANLALYQVDDPDYQNQLEVYDKSMKKEISKGGSLRACVINGKEFYSLGAAAQYYGVSRQTLHNRIANTKNSKFRKWNYADEDLDLKYKKKDR